METNAVKMLQEDRKMTFSQLKQTNVIYVMPFMSLRAKNDFMSNVSFPVNPKKECHFKQEHYKLN